jgi:hypothetical protein
MEDLYRFFDISPMKYSGIFPPVNVDLNKIQALIDEGTFPTIPKLFPGVVYAVLLSILRLVLHRFVFKV